MKYLLLPIATLIITSYLLSKIPNDTNTKSPEKPVKKVVQIQQLPSRSDTTKEKQETILLRDTDRSDTHKLNLVRLITKYFGSESKIAVAIAYAESGMRCDAVSPTNDHGLMQVNMRWHANKFSKSPYDCEENIRVAYQIFKDSGWNAWSTFKNGAYKKFL